MSNAELIKAIADVTARLSSLCASRTGYFRMSVENEERTTVEAMAARILCSYQAGGRSTEFTHRRLPFSQIMERRQRRPELKLLHEIEYTPALFCVGNESRRECTREAAIMARRGYSVARRMFCVCDRRRETNGAGVELDRRR